MSRVAYSLRPSTDDDLPFVAALVRANRAAEAQRQIGPEAEEAPASIEGRFRPGRDWIVTSDGEQIGVLSLDRRADAVIVRHIALLPEFQNRGIGSALIRGVLDFAVTVKLPVRLRLLKDNPARSLYERLGFAVTSEDGQRYEMTARPAGA